MYYVHKCPLTWHRCVNYSNLLGLTLTQPSSNPIQHGGNQDVTNKAATTTTITTTITTIIITITTAITTITTITTTNNNNKKKKNNSSANMDFTYFHQAEAG